MANPFSLFDEDELLALLSALKLEQMAIIQGKKFISGSEGGKSFSRAVRTAKEVQEDLRNVGDALSAVDPDAYEMTDNITYGGFQ